MTETVPLKPATLRNRNLQETTRSALPSEGKGPVERIQKLGNKGGGRIKEIAEIVFNTREVRNVRKTNNVKTEVRRRRRQRALGGKRREVIGHGEGGQEGLELPPGGVAAKSERNEEKAQARREREEADKEETSMPKTHQLVAADRSAEGDSRRKAQAGDPSEPENQAPQTETKGTKRQKVHRRKVVHQTLVVDDQAHGAPAAESI